MRRRANIVLMALVLLLVVAGVIFCFFPRTFELPEGITRIEILDGADLYELSEEQTEEILQYLNGQAVGYGRAALQANPGGITVSFYEHEALLGQIYVVGLSDIYSFGAYPVKYRAAKEGMQQYLRDYVLEMHP